MARLILFRHAKAVRQAALGDKDRALERRGRETAERMGDWLRESNLVPDLALVSDARRTRETFTLAAGRLGAPVPSRLEPRIYEASPESLLRLVRLTDPRVETLLLVGHNPGLAEFAALLTGRGDRIALSRLRLKFPTAAIAQFAWSGPVSEAQIGGCELVRFVTPNSLDPNGGDD
jgi:phosphohistidine phosphatase